VLGLIPARGGSKGVPRKNVRPLLGRPLIEYTIEAARGSRHLDRVVVTTDDPEIREVALRAGAEAPFLRPAELATDTARAIPVIQHAVRALEAEEGRRYDAICYLEPPSPLRLAEDIDGAIEKFFATQPCDSVISVVESNHYHPIYMKKIVADRIEPYVLPEPEGMPRQLFDPPCFLRNGAVYVFWRDNAVEMGTLRGEVSRPFVMPPERAVCIDSVEDWYLAEALLRERQPR
jgi:CMP-N-acetylneuraminic acid synthetase